MIADDTPQMDSGIQTKLGRNIGKIGPNGYDVLTQTL
jgi:hypothetical protein